MFKNKHFLDLPLSALVLIGLFAGAGMAASMAWLFHMY